jgi:hypothetical protein
MQDFTTIMTFGTAIAENGGDGLFAFAESVGDLDQPVYEASSTSRWCPTRQAHR